MGVHTRKDGIEVFNVIENIGESLGYLVRRENPMQKKKGAQTIDICWFLDELSDYPIMIFEIESKAQNYIYNNVCKVFAKSNQEFLKPLFFFHIIVSSSDESEKKDDLEKLFGSYNYRVYELNKDEAKSDLIIDILSQHRRIKNKYNLYWLLHCIKDDIQFWGQISIDKTIEWVEKTIGIEEKKYILPHYMRFSEEYNYFKKHVYRILKNREELNILEIQKDEFNSHFADEWKIIIYYAILCFQEDDEERQIYYFNKVKSLIEDSGYRFYFTLGNSQDCNDFLLGFSGTVLALLFCLTRKTIGAEGYFCKKLELIIEECKKIVNYDLISFNCIWLLYLSSSSDEFEYIFDNTREYMNNNGGVYRELLLNTPSIFTEEDLEFLQENSDKESIPKIDFFKGDNTKIKSKITIEQVVFKMLIEEEYLFKCSNDIIYNIKNK